MNNHQLLYNISIFRHKADKTPTLKAMRSNRTGRTKENPEAAKVSGLFICSDMYEYVRL